MLAELPIHADAAEALSGVDDVAAHSWFQEMLRGGWNPNLPLADGLLLEDRFYLGPFPVELDLLVRCCGPEPGIAYLDPVSSWQPRVDAFAQMITAGFQMPLLAAGADLRLMDGNHRAAGALQAGVRRFPTIILFASPEERSRWAKEYLDGTLGRRLSGGHVTEVVRVSAAVRRSTTERSSFVWQLLADLERVDFAGAPRFVGVDGAGRETLSYIEGDVHPRGYQSLEQIRSAAALLRELHDATTGLSGAEGVLVIHGDPKPRNTVYDGQQAVAFIDFDNARIGSAAEDVGYLAWQFALNSYVDPEQLEAQKASLEAVCDGYQLDDPTSLLDWVAEAQERTLRNARSSDVRD